MNDYIVTVNIYCAWQGKPKSYRVYIDNELLTERTYVWDNISEYVEENIVINVEPGIHNFKIESVPSWFKGFTFNNFKVNDVDTYIDPVTGEFTI